MLWKRPFFSGKNQHFEGCAIKQESFGLSFAGILAALLPEVILLTALHAFVTSVRLFAAHRVPHRSRIGLLALLLQSRQKHQLSPDCQDVSWAKNTNSRIQAH